MKRRNRTRRSRDVIRIPRELQSQDFGKDISDATYVSGYIDDHEVVIEYEEQIKTMLDEIDEKQQNTETKMMFYTFRTVFIVFFFCLRVSFSFYLCVCVCFIFFCAFFSLCVYFLLLKYIYIYIYIYIYVYVCVPFVDFFFWNTCVSFLICTCVCVFVFMCMYVSVFSLLFCEISFLS